MRREWISRSIFQTCAGIVIVALAVIYLFVGTQAFSLFTRDGVSLVTFFTSAKWDGSTNFGILVYIVGSLSLIALGLILAIPLSLGLAIFVNEIAPPWLSRFMRGVIELFLGIPSVIFGILGALILVPAISRLLNYFAGGQYYRGIGIVPAAIVVAFMVMPTITTITIDALSNIPRDLREGSLALGATQWQTISKILLPASISGILTGVILGAARILGETIAVALVIGGGLDFPLRFTNIYPYAFPGSTATLTSVLIQNFGEAQPGAAVYDALWSAAFVLMIISGIMVGVSRTIAARRIYV